MSKSSRKRRVTSRNANQRLPLSSEYRLSPYDASRQMSFDFNSALRALEDRRTWHPEGPNRPARSFNRSNHQIVVGPDPASRSGRSEPYRPSKPWRTLPSIVAFGEPENVAVCVRREQRREVLHAKKKTGRRGQKKPRWTKLSRVSCRR